MTSGNLDARLAKLESKVDSSQNAARWLRVIGQSTAECEDQMAAMLATGIARTTDNFAFRVLVSP